MVAVQGYYDGTAIKPLERISVKPYQRVIITIMDEYLDPVSSDVKNGKNLRGILSQYADPSLAEKEKGAWERAMAERHGTV